MPTVERYEGVDADFDAFIASCKIVIADDVGGGGNHVGLVGYALDLKGRQVPIRID